MMEFKKGDHVVCIWESSGYLTLGKVYTISEVSEEKWNNARIEVYSDRKEYDSFYPERFRLATLLEKELSGL